MEGTVRIVLQILAICSPVLCSGEQAVPLIAWSNTRSLANTPRISAGKVVTREELGTNYMDSILQTQPQNVLLFVFDELSIDDITRFSDARNADGQGGALSHLKKAMSESLSHLVLPAVEPGDLEGDLSTKINGAVTDLKEPTLDGVNFDLSKTNLLVAHLSVASGNSDSKQDAFAQADTIIDSLVQGQKAHYTAILTAEHKSKSEPTSPKGDRLTVGRRLLQDEKTTFIAHYESDKEPKCNVYMTADAISLVTDLSSQKPTVVTLPNKYGDWLTTGTCRMENNQLIVALNMSLETTTDLDKFVMSLSFSTSPLNSWFVLPTSSVEFAEKGDEPIMYNLRTGITDTPLKFSYHCTSTVFHLTPQAGTKGGAEAHLKISEFQIQPYEITRMKTADTVSDGFGPANDCVGFFTEGIWMGLFMGLIMLLIFSFGLGMLINLKVMDKFDDPKGKTITINTAAE